MSGTGNVLSLDARLKLLEENINVGTWTADSGLAEVFWSSGFFRLVGFDPLLVRPSIDLMRSIVHPDDKMAFEGLLSFSQARSTNRRGFRIIRVDGTQRNILGKTQTHYTREGVTRLLFGVFIDYTSEAESLERSKLIAAHRNVAVHLLGGHPWVADANGKFLDSAHWEALTGLQVQSEIDWSERLSAIHVDDRELFSNAWTSAIANRTSYSATVRIKMLDGTYQCFASRAEPVLGDDGRLAYWIGHSTPTAEADPVSVASGLGAAHIRAARGFLGWSVHELADKSGIPYGTLRRIEEGNGEIKSLHLDLLVGLFQQFGLEFLDRHDGRLIIVSPKSPRFPETAATN